MNKRIRKKQLKKIGKYVPNSDTWSLDITLAKFIFPRLQLFRKVTDCFPSSLNSLDEWHSILDKMINAFYLISEGIDNHETLDEIIEEGLELFKKYYRSLWW